MSVSPQALIEAGLPDEAAAEVAKHARIIRARAGDGAGYLPPPAGLRSRRRPAAT